MAERMCGDPTCEICPTPGEFDALMELARREHLRAANIMLGLPENYGLGEADG